MRNKRVIVVAVGQKGVRYGNANGFPRVVLVFVDVCKAQYYDISAGGLVVAYLASPYSFRLLQQFLSYTEAVREILPDLGIGIAEGNGVPDCFRWFWQRQRFTIDRQAEERALAGVQGIQTYQDEFNRLRVA